MAAMYGLVCILSLSFNSCVEEEITTAEKYGTEENNNEEAGDEKAGMSLYCSVWGFPAYTVLVTSFMLVTFGKYIPYINLVSLNCELSRFVLPSS